MQAENREPTIADVLTRLDRIDSDIKDLRDGLKETNIKFDSYVKASDRLLGVATTIIITAGTVTILSPFVQSVAPAIRAFLSSNSG